MARGDGDGGAADAGGGAPSAAALATFAEAAARDRDRDAAAAAEVQRLRAAAAEDVRRLEEKIAVYHGLAPLSADELGWLIESKATNAYLVAERHETDAQKAYGDTVSQHKSHPSAEVLTCCELFVCACVPNPLRFGYYSDASMKVESSNGSAGGWRRF